MFLSDVDIKKGVRAGEITIEGFDRRRLQPASYDILLGNRFVLTDPHTASAIDPVKKIFPKSREVMVDKGGYFMLHPGATVLGTSVDFFGSDKYLIQLSGKSSLARIGLIVHNTAGIVNPGHYLHITFELCNLNNIPIVLRPGMPIAQLLFSRLSSPPAGKYVKPRYFGEKETRKRRGAAKSRSRIKKK